MSKSMFVHWQHKFKAILNYVSSKMTTFLKKNNKSDHHSKSVNNLKIA